MISDKPGVQDLLSLFKQKKIRKIIIAPGSRNAPLTLSFSEDKYFECFSIPDERSAAFFALGMAQKDCHPVAVVCTSGSALLNFYPAVAEAYYQKIPMVVISADRPQEWIDQADGQTIRQVGALKKHAKYSVNLLQEPQSKDDRLYNQRLINEAINHSLNGRKGPVHINFPFKEPLYQQVNKGANNAKNISIASTKNYLTESGILSIADLWNSSAKKMILIGVHSHSEQLKKAIDSISQQAVVFTETTSNIAGEFTFNTIDRLIKTISIEEEKDLSPDLLITLGGPVISKHIKAILRNNPPLHHLHISEDDWHLDTYQCLTQSIPVEINTFFDQLMPLIQLEEKCDYFETWSSINEKKRQAHNHYVSTMPWSDHSAFHSIHQVIPSDYHIHLANSASVRYAQLYDWPASNIFYCNRGTSGIDGSTSTAIGYAISTKSPTCLISGDVSFLYDSNAFWNHHVPSNFRAIVINNSGGGIFRIIPGPDSTNALATFFETQHDFTAEGIMSTFKIDYKKVQSKQELEELLPAFLNQGSGKPAVLEIRTPALDNAMILKEYFKTLKTMEI